MVNSENLSKASIIVILGIGILNVFSSFWDSRDAIIENTKSIVEYIPILNENPNSTNYILFLITFIIIVIALVLLSYALRLVFPAILRDIKEYINQIYKAILGRSLPDFVNKPDEGILLYGKDNRMVVMRVKTVQTLIDNLVKPYFLFSWDKVSGNNCLIEYLINKYNINKLDITIEKKDDTTIFILGENRKISFQINNIETEAALIIDGQPIPLDIYKEDNSLRIYKKNNIQKETGYDIGKSFGVDFARELFDLKGIDASDKKLVLSEWEKYDSPAGWGRLNFNGISENNLSGQLKIKNCFLCNHRSHRNPCQCHFFEGYIEGAMGSIFDNTGPKQIKFIKMEERNICIFEVTNLDNHIM